MYANEDVLWLEISVDDSVSVELIEGNRDLHHEKANRIVRHTTIREPTRLNGMRNITDVHVGDDVKGGSVIEGGDER